MRFMFPKEVRLLTSKDFRDVLRQKRSFRLTNKFSRIIVKRNNIKTPRLGFIIAKKEIPKAVERNRIKRIIRESFRINKHQLIGYDIVIIVNHIAISMSSREIRQHQDKLWKKLNSYPEKS